MYKASDEKHSMWPKTNQTSYLQLIIQSSDFIWGKECNNGLLPWIADGNVTLIVWPSGYLLDHWYRGKNSPLLLSHVNTVALRLDSKTLGFDRIYKSDRILARKIWAFGQKMIKKKKVKLTFLVTCIFLFLITLWECGILGLLNSSGFLTLKK